jgi:hypothetical protein
VAYLLKAGFVELGETAFARQQLFKHSAIPVPIAKHHTHAAVEEMLEAVFSTRFVSRLYNEDQLVRG